MTTRLYRYQKQGVRRIEAFGGRALLADDPGLGKTIQSLMFYHRNPGARPAVVVTFASLKYNWERECKVHINVPAEVLEGTRPPKGRRLVSSSPLVIINYDILSYWLKYLKRLKPGLVIIDECQAVRNSHTLRSRSVKKLCADVPNVIALSATPLMHRPRELFPTLHILRPDLYPAFKSFAYEFCRPKWTPWGTNFDGASNLDILNAQLEEHVMIRRRKADVLRDLPAKTRQIVPLPLDDPNEYFEAQNNFITWLRKTHGDAKARKAAKAHRLVQMGYLKRLAGRKKLPAVGEWLDLFLENSGEKMAVFAVHKDVIAWLHERYARRCVVVDGSITGRNRQRAFDQFLRDRKCRFLFGNIQAAGAGWSAKGVANEAVIELPWAPGDLIQVEDRAHGLGRGVDGVVTNIAYLVAHGTIEEKLLKLLQDKQDVLTQTLDGRSGNGTDLNIYDLLEAELTKDENRFGL